MNPTKTTVCWPCLVGSKIALAATHAQNAKQFSAQLCPTELILGIWIWTSPFVYPRGPTTLTMLTTRSAEKSQAKSNKGGQNDPAWLSCTRLPVAHLAACPFGFALVRSC